MGRELFSRQPGARMSRWFRGEGQAPQNVARGWAAWTGRRQLSPVRTIGSLGRPIDGRIAVVFAFTVTGCRPLAGARQGTMSTPVRSGMGSDYLGGGQQDAYPVYCLRGVGLRQDSMRHGILFWNARRISWLWWTLMVGLGTSITRLRGCLRVAKA